MLSCAGDGASLTCSTETCATERVAESKSRRNNFEDRMCLAPWQESVAAVRRPHGCRLVDRAVAVERAVAAWQARAGMGAIASTKRRVYVRKVTHSGQRVVIDAIADARA